MQPMGMGHLRTHAFFVSFAELLLQLAIASAAQVGLGLRPMLDLVGVCGVFCLVTVVGLPDYAAEDPNRATFVGCSVTLRS